jgi:hypothetical protein
MRWEQVPDLPLFATNTAAFIHDMDEAAISNVAGESKYVRVQVLTPSEYSTASGWGIGGHANTNADIAALARAAAIAEQQR